MNKHIDGATPITLFYSYAHEDESLREQLEKHLRQLRRQGLISEWNDRQIVAGTEWAQEIDKHLEAASIILLLISADFLGSDYCYDIEMQRAMERYQRGEAQVIPIILRPCDWRNSPFARLQCLPRGGKAVETWPNRDEAFLDITKGLREIIERQQIPVRPLSQEERENRTKLMKDVRAYWIEGRLKPSLPLPLENPIPLDLEERPDVLATRWGREDQETILPPHPLPAGTSITKVYDDADGKLLILGEPGSGKTMLLLELARDLLDRAEQDETRPMPVYFTLSSWANKPQQLLEDWLVEELKRKYGVPLQTAQEWLFTDCILPLLDGLDEVALAHRGACLGAINAYRSEHVVVCSRREQYFSQITRLRLDKAVMVLPLTEQLINGYLESAGEPLAALRKVLQRDTDLLSLATTPLMLSVMIHTYRGKAPDDLTITGPPEVQPQQVFAAYVQSMLKRRGASYHYKDKQQQTIDWLKWLASWMAQDHQAEFYLEWMQPDWLWEKRLRRFYKWTVGRPLDCVLLALVRAVSSGIPAILVVILVSTLWAGISKEVLGALLGIFPAGVLISLVGGIWHGWRKGLFTAAIGIPVGALAGALISRVISVPDRPTMGLIVGLITGGVIGLLASLIGKEGDSGISITPGVAWSWESVRRGFKRENKELQVVSVLTGVSCILVGAVVTVEKGVFSGLGMGGVTLLAGLLLFVLYRGIKSKSLSKHARFAPNHRIWLSALKGLIVCLAVGSCAFTSTWLIISSVAGSAIGWTCGLLAGVVFGIGTGWGYGWNACVRHLVLRVLLRRAGSIPRNYTRFLDYAVERILLRQIGGGYEFIHRLLQKYFALQKMKENPGTNDATIYHKRGLIFAEFSEHEQAINNYTHAINLDSKKAVFVYRDRGLEYAGRKEYQQAIEDYTRAIKLDPKDIWTYYLRGGIYLKLREYEKAIADFTQMIKLDRRNAWTYSQRGNIYHELEEYEKAIADFTQAIKLGPKRAFLYWVRARSYRFNKEYKKAIDDYTSALKLPPQDAQLYFERGLVYVDLKVYKKAIDDYTSALNLNRHEARFYTERGIAHFGLEEYEKAIADFTQAIKLGPKRAFLYWVRARSYHFNKEYKKAIDDYTSALKLPPQDAQLYFERGLVYADLKVYKKAFADITHAIKLAPQEAWYYKTRSQIYINLQEYEKAIADLSTAIGLASQEAEFYQDRGFAYTKLKEYQSAIADFDRAIELEPKQAWVYRDRGNAYLELKEYKRALEDYTRAIELEPKQAGAYFRRGYTYLWLKDLSQAKANFMQSWQLDPTDTNYGWMMEFVDMCQKKPSLAMIQRLETLAERNPESHYAYICKGVAHLLCGEFKIALKELEQASKLDPDSEDAYFWISSAYASLGQDDEAKAAIDRSLELKLPPVLLTPLRWLDEDKQDLYEKYVEPLLMRYNILPHQETSE